MGSVLNSVLVLRLIGHVTGRSIFGVVLDLMNYKQHRMNYPTLIPKKEISFLAVEWIFDFDSSSNIISIKILSFSFRCSITMRVMVTKRSSSSLEPFRLFSKKWTFSGIV